MANDTNTQRRRYVLNAPFSISSRLMPALVVGGATLSLDYGHYDRDGRMVWKGFIDLPDGSEHEITDFRSGCGGGTLQSGFENLCGFLSAAAESWNYAGEKGENSDLFARPVVIWAAEHSDELSLLACEIEETPGLISEQE